MLWVGIDEAGYGPNLGPLVMTAIVAETTEASRPDLWGHRAGRIARAAGVLDALWIDDSKRLYRGGVGLDRLEAATLATLDAIGWPERPPISLGSLSDALCKCTLDDLELTDWLDGLEPGPLPSLPWADRVLSWTTGRPLHDDRWKIVAARAVMIGPEAFNTILATTGNKTVVHQCAFRRLLEWLWTLSDGGMPVHVRSDKHGGRTYYAEFLRQSLPLADVWIGREAAASSHYRLTGAGRHLDVEFLPRADRDDGLVALASIVSKYLRERWMGVFNAFWARRLDGLTPTAGYPVDALRFRAAIEPLSRELGLVPNRWWRLK